MEQEGGRRRGGEEVGQEGGKKRDRGRREELRMQEREE